MSTRIEKSNIHTSSSAIIERLHCRMG